MASRRTILLAFAGIVAAIPVYRYGRAYLEPLPEFEPLGDPAGFRRISGGPSSTGYNPWVGLDGSAERPALVSEPEIRADICRALYGPPARQARTIPIASFSDYYCPYCRIQTRRLAALASELGDEIRVSWHELPLLGDTSILAAKAALAAKRQGAYVQFHERLMSSAFQATPEYLRAMAESIGVDHARLVADMNSEMILKEIDTSSTLSRIFGFIGTPAMVIGRTVIQGQVSDRTIRKIIAIERKEGWSAVC